MRQMAGQGRGGVAQRRPAPWEGLAQMGMAVLVLVAVGVTPVGAAARGPFSKVVVFGDSLSDTGNAFIATRHTIPPSPPYFQGRFSNGPVWVEDLAAALEHDVVPFLAGGTNFAFGSAQTSGLLLQVSLFLLKNLLHADPRALYIVWGGATDIRQAVRDVVEGGGDQSAAGDATRVAVRNIAKVLRLLALAGAKDILVPNIPDIGQIPETTALGRPDAVTLASNLTRTFNAALEDVLDTLESRFGIRVIQRDTFALFEAVRARPGTFGFANVTAGCLDGDPLTFTTVCSDDLAVQNTHVFWDNQHPTTAAHALLAEEAIAALYTAVPAAATP
jgi:phospholipase/lecithinase/hemolysin